MASLFIEIYWSVGEFCETILKWYWRVLNCNFEDSSNNYYFFQRFLLNRAENCNKDSSMETHFKSSKTSRGSYLDLVFMFVKIFNYISWPSPFKGTQAWDI